MSPIEHLKEVMNSYHPLSESCWTDMKSIVKERTAKKNEVLIRLGDIPTKFFFVHKGLARAYVISSNESAKEINKTFFDEGRFPASVIAALCKSPSEVCVEALEDSFLLEIDHTKYRGLLKIHDDLKWYHINYLEKHWVREKEPIEIALLEGEAKKRYLDFVSKNEKLAQRIPLFHLASRLGITPTQLSRIRKLIKE